MPESTLALISNGSPPPVPAEAPLATGPRIVIAEDDPTARLILAGVLTAAGYQVAEASDGTEALLRIREAKPALVILDIEMPGVDGFEVCRAVRTGPDPAGGPQVLVLTGREDSATVTQAFDAGATDFAGKPIAAELLLHRVKFLLRNQAAINRLRQSEASLENAQRIARLGSWEWHLPTGVFGFSRPALALLHLPATTELGFEDYLERVIAEDRATVEQALLAARGGAPAVEVRHRVLQADGSVQHLQLRARLARDLDGRPEYLRGTLQDITERVEAEETIRRLANFDQLTGLPNRARFSEQVRQVLGRARREQHSAAVLLLDLNHFKRVNDALGHAGGDGLLAAVGRRLQDTLRAGDAAPMLARLGGDEFMVVLGDLARSDEAATVARRMLSALRRPFQIDGNEIRLSARIGISVYPHDGNDPDELIKHAESALGQARQAEHGTFEFFDRALSQAAAARLALEDSVRRAVEREEFTLFYQPMVDATGRTVGAEALLRWFLPDGRMVPAANILPILEQKDLISTVVMWTLRTALDQLKTWDALGLVLPRLAINLSPVQVADPQLPDQLHAMVREAGIAPERIMLEIVERGLIEQPAAAAVLGHLRSRGFRIALDDFGTGYSALSYLRRFPLDTLKIDRSFVRGLPGDARQAAILKAILALSEELGIEPVGEGVEEPGQRDHLIQAGCRLLQGHLFAPALPPDEFALRLGPDSQPRED